MIQTALNIADFLRFKQDFVSNVIISTERFTRLIKFVARIQLWAHQLGGLLATKTTKNKNRSYIYFSLKGDK